MLTGHDLFKPMQLTTVIDFFTSRMKAIFWAERKALSIFVDPYCTRIVSGTVNFLPMARYGGVVKNSAAMSSGLQELKNLLDNRFSSC